MEWDFSFVRCFLQDSTSSYSAKLSTLSRDLSAEDEERLVFRDILLPHSLVVRVACVLSTRIWIKLNVSADGE